MLPPSGFPVSLFLDGSLLRFLGTPELVLGLWDWRFLVYIRLAWAPWSPSRSVSPREGGYQDEEPELQDHEDNGLLAKLDVQYRQDTHVVLNPHTHTIRTSTSMTLPEQQPWIVFSLRSLSAYAGLVFWDGKQVMTFQLLGLPWRLEHTRAGVGSINTTQTGQDGSGKGGGGGEEQER